jgi:uncharacterized protein YutE (UPF0331/DUF86 family)
MRHVLKLLRSVNLIKEGEYDDFLSAANYRNHIVHRMYSQWTEELPTLRNKADLTIKCVRLILEKLRHP